MMMNHTVVQKYANAIISFNNNEGLNCDINSSFYKSHESKHNGNDVNCQTNGRGDVCAAVSMVPSKVLLKRDEMSVDTSQKTSLGKKVMQVQPEPDSIKAVVSKETVVSKAEEDGCLEKESNQEEEKSILNDFCVTGTSQFKHMPLVECSAENQKIIVSTRQKVTDHKLRDSVMKEGAEGNTLPDEPKPYLNKSEENNQEEIVSNTQLVGGTMASKAIKDNDFIISEPNEEGIYGYKKTDNESSSHASHDISAINVEMSTVAVIKKDEPIPDMSKNMNIDKTAVKVALSTCRHDKNQPVSAASDSEKAGDNVTENIQKKTMHPRELTLTSISNHNMIPTTSQNTQEQSNESGKMVNLSSIEQIQQMNSEVQEVKSLAVFNWQHSEE
ncbi:uncharacterized protein LOC114660061 [Erpetoichthys calabaricus]|uniref:uncharacterized protein LOC114660061 n=1 Tax=Erpetoichthys calabaricus TaxID=27687 RepID=UPI002234C225|nr:uncharacterized protein LOC114660061 [Erpetoichthys calabaricus]XP_028668405.2 uncharacterized protein LOC114660061 [Erpetoichthys calabaricus]